MLNKIKYWLSDEAVEGSPFWDKVKYATCGEHWFGNLTAPFWENISCTCCAFYRGLIIGIALTGAVCLTLM